MSTEKIIAGISAAVGALGLLWGSNEAAKRKKAEATSRTVILASVLRDVALADKVRAVNAKAEEINAKVREVNSKIEEVNEGSKT